MASKKRLALHWQILIGMALGVGLGLGAVAADLSLNWHWGEHVDVEIRDRIPQQTPGIYFAEDEQKYYEVVPQTDKETGQSVFLTRPFQPSFFKHLVTLWVKPFGALFVNLLKLIAIPLIIASLIKGVSDLRDLSKLSSMGGRTVAYYLFTTVCAVVLGLLIVNVVQPGSGFSEETKEALTAGFDDKAREKIQDAMAQRDKGPLQPLVDVVPSNIFQAATSNGNMLQVIFFVILFGVGLILIEPTKAKPVKDFFDALNEVVLKLIDLIMLIAPFGVMALLAAQVVGTPSWDALIGLLKYSGCVIFGLALMVFLFYPTLVMLVAKVNPMFFFKGIAPAQLLAFSTSSSAATLPVTMERVEEHLGVDREVSSFVLPIGATVNMDGTSLYQSVAAVFIAQALGIELGLYQQVTIVLTATLASIGSAAVPGAGMVMLVIVLGAIGVPESGLALIIAMDRILDMCRTSVNVTGDAAVSMMVARNAGKLGSPHPKEWDDNYPPSDEEEKPGEPDQAESSDA